MCLILYKDDLGADLQYSKEHSAETDVIHISRAAKVIKNYIFKKQQEFNRKFTKNYQDDSIPQSLVSSLWLITGASQNLEEIEEWSCNDFQAALSAA